MTTFINISKQEFETAFLSLKEKEWKKLQDIAFAFTGLNPRFTMFHVELNFNRFFPFGCENRKNAQTFLIGSIQGL